MPTAGFRNFLLLWSLLFAGIGSAAAQEDALASSSVEFRGALHRAVASFNARDFRAATKECDVLDKIQPDTAVVLNMRGAIALEERRFADGETFCKKAVEVDPKFFPARFNL